MDVSEDHRKRVAAARREKMRARLLESALQTIAAEGVGALTIDKLIAHAGVSRGTFYKYYEAPQAVIRELALGISNELIQHAEPLVQQTADPAARVATGVRALIHSCANHPVLGHCMIHLGWHDIHQQHLVFHYVKRDIEEGQKTGRFDKMPTDLALCLVGVSAIAGIQVALGAHTQNKGTAETTALAILRALGLQDAEARAIANAPLPPLGLPSGGLIDRTTNGVKRSARP